MSVVTLAEAKTHLNIAVATHDTEIQAFVDRAEAAIAQRCGPLAATAASARVRGGSDVLVLPVVPVVSVTTVTNAEGAAVTVADLHVDTKSAVVTYDLGTSFASRYYDVEYSAGRTTCPDDLKLAVLELVRHLWSSQRGPTQRPGSAQFDGAANTLPGAGYLLPFRVQELIAPHLQPGFA